MVLGFLRDTGPMPHPPYAAFITGKKSFFDLRLGYPGPQIEQNFIFLFSEDCSLIPPRYRQSRVAQCPQAAEATTGRPRGHNIPRTSDSSACEVISGAIIQRRWECALKVRILICE